MKLKCVDCGVEWDDSAGRECWSCGRTAAIPLPARTWPQHAALDVARAHGGERGAA